jgi:hypothetical protein
MRAIIEAIQAHGGPLTTDIPYEGF